LRTLQGLLERESDPEILAGALHALHRDTPPPALASAIAGTLGRLRAHADEEVRARAVAALAEWARDAAEVGAVAAALRDPAPRVRAAAAYALGVHRWPVPEVVAALTRSVADRNEDFEVRQLAWRALRLYPLDEAAYRAAEEFREEFKRVLEGR
jgi:HEAT repeat protein